MVRDVYVHGALGRTFGRHFRLDVASPAEAVRALLTLRPGIRAGIRAGLWRVIVGTPHISNGIGGDQLTMSMGRQPLHLVPATRPRGGGDDASIGKIIVGVIIIGVAIAMSPFTFGGSVAFAAAMAEAGALGITYGAVAMVGVSMVLAGVAGLLAPRVEPRGGPVDATERARPEDRPSFLFNGVTNNTQQGGPVPIVCGRHLVGSVVVSAGIATEDIAV